MAYRNPRNSGGCVRMDCIYFAVLCSGLSLEIDFRGEEFWANMGVVSASTSRNLVSLMGEDSSWFFPSRNHAQLREVAEAEKPPDALKIRNAFGGRFQIETFT